MKTSLKDVAVRDKNWDSNKEDLSLRTCNCLPVYL